MINISIKGQKELIKQLEKLGPKATAILRKELRPAAKEVMNVIKPLIPVDTGKLRRSLTVRVVKKKRRYTVAYRIIARPPKEGKYYAFAPNYGVTKRAAGKQSALHYMEKGIESATALMPATIQRIARAVEQAWKK